ncbi:MAG: precorrin-2 C(20)-methyltransferase [Dehalococcoidales bacterium]|nr:precorrin-2 C(20)-methyltransferase [Dehalococcoidales bacterium]
MGGEEKKIGRFYGIGVGPGDPALLTLKARGILAEVPVVFVPKKDDGSNSLARSIVSGVVGSEKEVVELVFPMTREKERLSAGWQAAADAIWSYLERGKDGALLNLGDPLLYGTFIPVMQVLCRLHPEVEIACVPGVSSVNAAAAAALVPLASEDEKVAIISGRCEEGFIRDVLGKFDTVVFLKVTGVFGHLLAVLEGLGAVEKCVYVERCGSAESRVVRDIRTLSGEKPHYLSLVIYRK